MALKALPNAIAFADIVFQNPGDREFLMGKLFTAYQSNDEDMQEDILHILREVGVVQYVHLEHYIGKV